MTNMEREFLKKITDVAKEEESKDSWLKIGFQRMEVNSRVNK